MLNFLLTALTLLFFAANSLLTRLALRGGELDGASFALVRVLSGALLLALLVFFRHSSFRPLARYGSWPAALALSGYLLLFSLAYLWLNAGMGALVLFAAVQFTMLAASIRRGDRPSPREWAGFALAFSGLIGLTLPGFTAPPLAGVLLMAGAGISWGFYSLLGRGIQHPIETTAGNFLRSAVLLVLPCWPLLTPSATTRGLALAALSGAVTSGLGYALWYRVVPQLGSRRAAVVQLTVPALAALAAVFLLSEPLTLRLLLGLFTVLGGVALVLAQHPSPQRQR